MKWYVAELIVCCRVGKGSGKNFLYDHQIKVLQASNHEMAYQKALKLGRTENHSYKNSAGAKVFWEFIGLANLNMLLENEICDGTEIHSRLQSGNPKNEIQSKRDLTVFWGERNKRKTAGELLNAVTKPFAPR
jgi:uncharacterized protein DUF4288